jgi:anthranilate synthase/aminodeoxychorismate synthase-like glutamine amidotransferase
MILVIDNYDSFTYNLVQYLGQCGAEVEVRRNDEVTWQEAEGMGPSGVLLSPGPCTPRESGVCLDILRAAMDGSGFGGTPIFGVCLGYQAIGFAAGAEVGAAKKIMHGKASQVEHDRKGVFAGLGSPLCVIRYHSLAVIEGTIPAEFEVSSRTLDDGEVMGMRHRELPIEGVLFHPEAALTERGLDMVRNFAARCV